MKIDRVRAQRAFAAYTAHYNAADPKVKLKIDHTYRVAALCARIAQSLALPPEDVDFSVLEESEWRTSCPYKGTARYWSFVGQPPAENVAWSYPEPFAAVADIEGYLCFYDDAAEITVED